MLQAFSPSQRTATERKGEKKKKGKILEVKTKENDKAGFFFFFLNQEC